MATTPLLMRLLLVLITTTSTTFLATTCMAQDLAKCLSLSGVDNFTVFSDAVADNSAFNRLFNLSIINLRFASPTLPKPAAIVLPSTKLHLRSTIACFRRSLLTIRIRSGGHSYEGLSYLARQSTPFAVIDLMNLNRVRVDPGSGSAWAESGATLGQIYHAVAAESNGSLAFSAGSCPTVGSGGHIAGGGFGLLSRKFGLAADNVIDAVLIDAAGRVLTRRSMGEDVFWAIRGGGGGGWGVVYAWRIRLRAVPERVTSFVVNRPGSSRRVAGLVHRWQAVGSGLPDGFYLSCFVGAGLPQLGRVGMSATFKGFYLGPVREAVSILAREFPELGVGGSDCRETSWIESVVIFSGLKEGSPVSGLLDRELHGKTYFKAKSDYVRTGISLPDLVSAMEMLSGQPRAYLIMDPYGGAMGRIGSGELPFPHRGGNMYAIQYLIECGEGEQWREEEYVGWLRRFYEHMGTFVSSAPRAAYVNYLDLDLGTVGSSNANANAAGAAAAAVAVEEARSWGERYFLGNYDRLVRAKTEIDPDNVFSNDQSVPPMGLQQFQGSRQNNNNNINIL